MTGSNTENDMTIEWSSPPFRILGSQSISNLCERKPLHLVSNAAIIPLAQGVGSYRAEPCSPMQKRASERLPEQ